MIEEYPVLTARHKRKRPVLDNNKKTDTNWEEIIKKLDEEKIAKAIKSEKSCSDE
jgi:hypothetical protein